MVRDPTVTFELPRDYLARFPDGDYTIGRGADPRTVAERAEHPDGARSKLRLEAGTPKKVDDESTTVYPREVAE